jgi:hypothetical protein
MRSRPAIVLGDHPSHGQLARVYLAQIWTVKLGGVPEGGAARPSPPRALHCYKRFKERLRGKEVAA